MSDHPEKACVHCHFFVRVRAPGERVRESRDTIDSKAREKAKGGDFSWKRESPYFLECHHGEWSESRDPGRSDDTRFEEYVQRDRGGIIALWDECPFIEHEPTMSLPAAEDRRERIKTRQENLLYAGLIALGGVIGGLFVLLA